MTTAAWPDIVGSPPPFANNPDRACVNTPTRVFFPTGNGDTAKQAKAICATCPLRQACVDYAVARPDLVGVWGGTTVRERVRLRGTTWTLAALATAGNRGIRRRTTSRRLRIGELDAKGLSAGQIADRLGVTVRTVQRHQAALRQAA